MIERWEGRAAARIVQVLREGDSFPLDTAVPGAPQLARAGGAALEPFERGAPVAASA